MIASFAMALRYSFGMLKEADKIEAAIAAALDKGLRTADIASPGMKTIGTSQMGDAVIAELVRPVA
jgi:3-isopropylmalate dehydrogenase